ncbi:hypothetical protein WICPIJ_008143 [Wickerhamomyces pijperi]|uniref:Uncharacterized protein n=1 Tax=Wickerhamomyces pijperi TaxID=599730 RepID=A0A9P8PYX3_WICPI|nr:hypothetical protein WICPIJ_008143 [Wickerhamomyces pijperi]
MNFFDCKLPWNPLDSCILSSILTFKITFINPFERIITRFGIVVESLDLFTCKEPTPLSFQPPLTSLRFKEYNLARHVNCCVSFSSPVETSLDSVVVEDVFSSDVMVSDGLLSLNAGEVESSVVFDGTASKMDFLEMADWKALPNVDLDPNTEPNVPFFDPEESVDEDCWSEESPSFLFSSEMADEVVVALEEEELPAEDKEPKILLLLDFVAEKAWAPNLVVAPKTNFFFVEDSSSFLWSDFVRLMSEPSGFGPSPSSSSCGLFVGLAVVVVVV